MWQKAGLKTPGESRPAGLWDLGPFQLEKPEVGRGSGPLGFSFANQLAGLSWDQRQVLELGGWETTPAQDLCS